MFGRKRIKELTRSLTVSRMMFSSLLVQYGDQMDEIKSIKASYDLQKGWVTNAKHDLAKKDVEIEELKKKIKELESMRMV